MMVIDCQLSNGYKLMSESGNDSKFIGEYWQVVHWLDVRVEVVTTSHPALTGIAR